MSIDCSYSLYPHHLLFFTTIHAEQEPFVANDIEEIDVRCKRMYWEDKDIQNILSRHASSLPSPTPLVVRVSHGADGYLSAFFFFFFFRT